MRGPDWEQILELIEEFVTGSPPRIRTSRMLSTIVSVDIVGSTERLGQLGDAAWNELLSDFYVRVERELARYVGEEIDRAGDGMLAIFDGPTRAIRCATAIQDAGRELGFTCGPAFIQARWNAWTGPCVASLSTSRLEWRRQGRGLRLEHRQGPRGRVSSRIRRRWNTSAQGCSRAEAAVSAH